MTDKKDKTFHKNQDAAAGEVQALEKQVAELSDKYLRAMADLENARKRAGADVENAARSRAIGVASQFLPLVDAIDAAAGHSPDDEGIQTLGKAAANVLAKLGVVRIETVGQTLNPQFHNAILTEESDLPENTITKEMQSGFMFGDAVLRAAMVAVASARKETDEKQD
jgi:molecular chaperone GrpE